MATFFKDGFPEKVNCSDENGQMLQETNYFYDDIFCKIRVTMKK